MKTTKFKPSEVGPIPVEWEVKRLGDCCKKIGSGATPTGGATVYLSHGVSLIRSQNVYNGYFKYEGLAHITDSAASALDGVTVQDDDVLLNITGDSVARCTKVPADVLPARVNQHVAIIRTCSEELGSDYLQCYLASPDMQTYMLNAASGQGGSRNAMTKGMVEDFQIPIPPLPEQKAIAEALSDMDALLAAMTTLIEKKRAIKQGTMQELLGMRHDEFGMRDEPIRRLAGFSGAWVEKRLGECGKSIRGVGYKPNQAHHEAGVGRTMLLRSNNVRDNVLNFEDVVFVADECVSEEQRMLCGDILICSANGSRNLVGKSARLNDDRAVTFGAFMMVFRPNETISSGLVCYLLQSDSYRQQIDDILTGSAINNLNAKDVLDLTFYVPPTLAEQKAIAAVLSDMDADIAALEAKRAKYERIKQGMMQELLTGKTRLVGKRIVLADSSLIWMYNL